jgi:hypothetical protein
MERFAAVITFEEYGKPSWGGWPFRKSVGRIQLPPFVKLGKALPLQQRKGIQGIICFIVIETGRQAA